MGSAVFLGLAAVDILYSVAGMPGENEKVVASRQEVLCGGPAANAAITYSFLGGKAAFVGALGRHPLAELMRQELETFGVEIHDLTASSDEIPSISSALISGATGSRTIISGHATRTPIPPARLDPAILNDAALLLVDGHHMDCAVAAAGEASRRQIPIVLDGGSWKPGMEKLLSGVSFAICSEQFQPPGVAGEKDVVSYLLNHGPHAAAITRGAEAIIWATRQDRGEITPQQIQAVDTLGAGDVFHGAFCRRLVDGSPFAEALEFASQVAAYSCCFLGTRSWMSAWARDHQK